MWRYQERRVLAHMEQAARLVDQLADGYHPFDVVADPYPVFAAIREVTPAFYSSEIDHWVVTRHADIKAILLDTRTYSAANTITPIHPVGEAAQRVLREGGWRLAPALGNNDPPDHSRSGVTSTAHLHPDVSRCLNRSCATRSTLPSTR